MRTVRFLANRGDPEAFLASTEQYRDSKLQQKTESFRSTL